jgi:uncharacterized membrane protein
MKKWYHSKTIWVNIIAATAFIAQSLTSFVIKPEEQAAILVIINLLLRAATKEELTK